MVCKDMPWLEVKFKSVLALAIELKPTPKLNPTTNSVFFILLLCMKYSFFEQVKIMFYKRFMLLYCQGAPLILLLK
jgi:hypothetical protein